MVAFFHAALPTHWLPFVLAGRGQGWTHGKTLAVTTLAGIGHTLFTSVLGLLVLWVGAETSRWTGGIFPYIAGGVLISVGLYYLARQAHGGPAHHHLRHHKFNHEHARPENEHHEPRLGYQLQTGRSGGTAGHRPSHRRSDAAVILGLLALLTFSPCEGFLPVYLSGTALGWQGFVLLTAILAIATVAGMVMFTWLTLAGMKRFKFGFLERFEHGVLGGALCVLGVAVMIFH